MNKLAGRSLNFELLRIVAMFMVVMLHVNDMGGLLKGYSPKEDLPCFLITQFFEYLCIIAVNLYILLSGYFLSASTHPFKMKKMFHIFLITIFWSWFIGGFACAFLGADIKDFLINGIFPVMFGRYWFVTTYVLMYFLSPYYNKVLQMLTKREYLVLILFLGCFFVLIPILRDPVCVNGGYGLYWFMYLYLIASFIRKFDISYKTKTLVFVWLVLLLLQVVVTYLVKIYSLPVSIVSLNYNSVFVLINALCCFGIFKSLKIERGRVLIKFFSPLTFGIYLIHINPATVSWIYTDLLPIREVAGNTVKGVLLSLICFTSLIFLISAILDFLRDRLFSYLKIEKRVYRVYERVVKIGV